MPRRTLPLDPGALEAIERGRRALGDDDGWLAIPRRAVRDTALAPEAKLILGALIVEGPDVLPKQLAVASGVPAERLGVHYRSLQQGGYFDRLIERAADDDLEN